MMRITLWTQAFLTLCQITFCQHAGLWTFLRTCTCIRPYRLKTFLRSEWRYLTLALYYNVLCTILVKTALCCFYLFCVLAHLGAFNALCVPVRIKKSAMRSGDISAFSCQLVLAFARRIVYGDGGGRCGPIVSTQPTMEQGTISDSVTLDHRSEMRAQSLALPNYNL